MGLPRARADPQLGVFGLCKAANRVGRAHIAAVINTLILAYAGTSARGAGNLVADAVRTAFECVPDPDTTGTDTTVILRGDSAR